MRYKSNIRSIEHRSTLPEERTAHEHRSHRPGLPDLGHGPLPVVRPARRRAPARGPACSPGTNRSISASAVGESAFRGGLRETVPASSNREVRACRVTAVSRPSSSWQLTDRGIALAPVVTAILVVAAVMVIGLTAWR